MASSAMRWAEASPKPSRLWQARTSSAKAPPPGTTTMGRGAGRGEAMAGHVLGKGLDQVDMAPRDDGLDAFDDRVVVERPADIVLERAGRRDHIDTDGEKHPL